MLADDILQLRNLKPEASGMIASAAGKKSKEVRIWFTPFGPFESVDEFHKYVRKGFPLDATESVFGEKVYLCHTTQYNFCMTHGDLTPRNMILDEKGRLVLIDWEMAGWRPEYWEFAKIFYNISASDFYDLIKTHFVNYERELAAERHLWRIFDQPWTY